MWLWMRMMCSRSEDDSFSASISSIWPPAMPSIPEALASSKTRALRIFASGCVSSSAKISKASVSKNLPQVSPWPHQIFCAQWACRAAGHHHPSQANHHGRGNSNARIQGCSYTQSAGAGHIEQARGLKHQKRPQAFSSAQRGIAHGIQQPRRGALGKQLLKHRIRGRCRVLQSCLKLNFGC